MSNSGLSSRIVAALTVLACVPAYPQGRAPALTDLSLEQLANIEVMSVSRRPERLVDAPASIYVITADDTRRSGVRTLPEALRLAPNPASARASAARLHGIRRALGWRVSSTFEVSLVLQNLFDCQHPEFGAAPGHSEYERSIFLKLLLRI